MISHLLTEERGVHELGHAALSVEDELDVAQRVQEPVAHQAPAHGGQRRVDRVEEGALSPGAALGLRQLQARAGGAVEDQVLARIHALKAQQVLAAPALGLEGVLHRCACSAHAEGVVLEAEALKALHLELLEEHAAARVPREAPGLTPGDALGEVQL